MDQDWPRCRWWILKLHAIYRPFILPGSTNSMTLRWYLCSLITSVSVSDELSEKTRWHMLPIVRIQLPALFSLCTCRHSWNCLPSSCSWSGSQVCHSLTAISLLFTLTSHCPRFSMKQIDFYSHALQTMYRSLTQVPNCPRINIDEFLRLSSTLRLRWSYYCFKIQKEWFTKPLGLRCSSIQLSWVMNL